MNNEIIILDDDVIGYAMLELYYWNKKQRYKETLALKKVMKKVSKTLYPRTGFIVVYSSRMKWE